MGMDTFQIGKDAEFKAVMYKMPDMPFKGPYKNIFKIIKCPCLTLTFGG